jgi:hypothetical protein
MLMVLLCSYGTVKPMSLVLKLSNVELNPVRSMLMEVDHRYGYSSANVTTLLFANVTTLLYANVMM